MKVFLGGEGPSELGGWSKEREYRDTHPEPGILESLMLKVQPNGWKIIHKTQIMINTTNILSHSNHHQPHITQTSQPF